MIASLVLVGYDRQSATIVTQAARTYLCPDKSWAASRPPVVVQTGAPPPPSGPLTTFSDGTWEVGTDIAPGKYKTPGTSTCYWARLRTTDNSDIIDNNLGAGPQVVTVKAGEFFQSQRCGTWTKAA